MRTSARNNFPGTVTRVTKGAVNAAVELTVNGNDKIVAIITNTSVEALDLSVGTALIKSSWVIVGKDLDKARLSTRNIMPGIVHAVKEGAVNSEITLKLAGGTLVTAIITNRSVRSLELKSRRRGIRRDQGKSRNSGRRVRQPVSQHPILCWALLQGAVYSPRRRKARCYSSPVLLQRFSKALYIRGLFRQFRFKIGKQEPTFPMSQLQPGEKAELSGVYKALHENNHASPHYVTVLHGNTFPN